LNFLRKSESASAFGWAQVRPRPLLSSQLIKYDKAALGPHKEQKERTFR